MTTLFDKEGAEGEGETPRLRSAVITGEASREEELEFVLVVRTRGSLPFGPLIDVSELPVCPCEPKS